MRIINICCIGAGYVGGPTMSVIALKCPEIKITVVDYSPEKIKSWNGPIDKLPVYEPGLPEIVKKVRGRNLFFSNNIKDSIKQAQMIFVAVNTPTKKTGKGAGMAADLKNIESCALDIAKYSNNNKIIVEKSTVPVRTAEKIKEIIIKENHHVHFEILSNPEFLAEGTAINDLLKSDRILIGGDPTREGQKAIKALVEIYTKWVPKGKILTTNIWSSELSKLASNAMLAQRISSINSLSSLCQKTGAKINELSRAIGLDHRIGPHFLEPSVGFGGSCFKKDILNLVYLCQYYGLYEVAEYWNQVVFINNHKIRDFASRIINKFSSDLSKIKIIILGWAFKANTNDSRESPSIYVAEELYMANASLSIYDPLVEKEKVINDIKTYWRKNKNFKKIISNISVLENKTFDVKSYDVCVILTEWEEFKEIDFKGKVVFDGRNLLIEAPNKNYEYHSL